MSTAKEKSHEMGEHLEATYEIELRRRIEQGLQDIAHGRVTPHEEVRRRILGG